jgi:hypothetical protein
MIFALDRPFRGDLGLGSDRYELIFDQLMENNPLTTNQKTNL